MNNKQRKQAGKCLAEADLLTPGQTHIVDQVFAHVVVASVCRSIKPQKRPSVSGTGPVESLRMLDRGQFGDRLTKAASLVLTISSGKG